MHFKDFAEFERNLSFTLGEKRKKKKILKLKIIRKLLIRKLRKIDTIKIKHVSMTFLNFKQIRPLILEKEGGEEFS